MMSRDLEIHLVEMIIDNRKVREKLMKQWWKGEKMDKDINTWRHLYIHSTDIHWVTIKCQSL